MKHLFVILILLLFTSLTIAQHYNDVDQEGNRNDADIEQQFVGSGTAYDGNEAYVDQIGNDNESDIYQDNNGYAGVAQYAKAYQNGNRNESDIEQFNSKHEGYTEQHGNDNDAVILQQRNNSWARVYQDGNDNDGDIEIWGSGAPLTKGYIVQVGNRNEADQELGDAMGKTVYDSWFEAHQYGNDNESDQVLEGDGFAGGSTVYNNSGFVFQDGNRNDADQDILLGGGMNNNVNNQAWIYQYNDDNKAKQTMRGDGNYSNIYQMGNENKAVSLQN